MALSSVSDVKSVIGVDMSSADETAITNIFIPAADAAIKNYVLFSNEDFKINSLNKLSISRFSSNIGKTIDSNNNEVEMKGKGRHDPCVGIRGVPVAEAMMSLVLADLLMRHKAQCDFDLS